MKTELKAILDTQDKVRFEVWFDGKKIGEVVGSDGAGVQVTSKLPMLPQWHPDQKKMVEIRIATDLPLA